MKTNFPEPKKCKKVNCFAIIGVLAVLGLIALTVYKYVLDRDDDDFFYDGEDDYDDEDYFDENGCVYADERDFE